MKPRNLVYTIFSAITLFLLTALPVSAQSIFPKFINDLIGGNAVLTLVNRAQVGFMLAFGVVIIIAVIYIIFTAIKYIRSRGESGEMETSTKSMQAIFMGVAAIFIGILGIAVVISFFGPNIDIITPQTICIQAPDSAGCYACKHRDRSDSNEDICNRCNTNPNSDLGDVNIVAEADGYDVYRDQDGRELLGESFTCTDKAYGVRRL